MKNSLRRVKIFAYDCDFYDRLREYRVRQSASVSHNLSSWLYSCTRPSSEKNKHPFVISAFINSVWWIVVKKVFGKYLESLFDKEKECTYIHVVYTERERESVYKCGWRTNELVHKLIFKLNHIREERSVNRTLTEREIN